MKRTRADDLIVEACAEAVAGGRPRPSKRELAKLTGLNPDTVRVRLPRLVADGVIPARIGSCLCGDPQAVNDQSTCPMCVDSDAAPTTKRAVIEYTYATFGCARDGGKRHCDICCKWSLVVRPGEFAMLFGCGTCGTERMPKAKRDAWTVRLLATKGLRCADVTWAPSREGGFPPGVVETGPRTRARD